MKRWDHLREQDLRNHSLEVIKSSVDIISEEWTNHIKTSLFSFEAYQVYFKTEDQKKRTLTHRTQTQTKDSQSNGSIERF